MALSLLLGAPAVALARQEADQPRYARVTADEARILNLADANGIELCRPERGSLVAVHRELAGWLEVEVPGGFAVWVHGRYLRPTEEPGVYEVTRNAVNIRPRPKSDVTSFPLPQRLHAGDRVRVIEQADASLPLSESWVRFWSPPGVHAWILAEQTGPLEAGASGAALWQAALAGSAPGAQPVAREASSPAAESKGAAPAAPAASQADQAAARGRLGEVTERIEAQTASESPDYAPIRSDLQEIIASAPSGAAAAEARAELSHVELLEEAARLRAELEAMRERQEAAMGSRWREVREASRAKDPLGEVFLARGVLLRSVPVDEAPRYHLRFGGELVCEVVCSARRYDLDLFSGKEVGVFGEELKLSAEVAGPLPVIDVRRLEVIANR